MVMDDRVRDQIYLEAKQNVCDGILYEPRIYCDIFRLSSSQLVDAGSPDVFRNGEENPVRITHMMAAVRSANVATPTDDRLIQRVGVRLRDHDDWYMSSEFMPLPHMHNVVTAPVDTMAQNIASWKFERPVLMAKRDAFEVKVALEAAIPDADGTVMVCVTFHGVGAISRKPKQVSGYVEFVFADGIASKTIPTDRFRNRGSEPLEVDVMVISASPGSTATSPVGTIRNTRVSVRQIGSGTLTRWTVCPVTSIPTNPLIDQTVPAVLWGQSVGRCVVHRFPDADDGLPGWLWYPNQGLQPELNSLVSLGEDDDIAVYFAMAGYAIIK